MSVKRSKKKRTGDHKILDDEKNRRKDETHIAAAETETDCAGKALVGGFESQEVVCEPRSSHCVHIKGQD